MGRLRIEYDSGLLESISADFDLRAPNKEALRRLVFTLDGDYDPDVVQVLNLATGVGKTYLMAAFVEYLRRQGVGNVMIVTPGKTVQAKTVQNFSEGSARYIAGSPCPPDVVTPQDYSAWIARINGPARLSYGREVPMLAFIFNIQQLIAPKSLEGDTHGGTQDAQRRKPRRFDENAGVLFDYLKELDDLVVIADESHLYSESAAAFNAALKELDPAATVGLTASAMPGDHIIYRYPLYRAIKDRYVKAPVLAFRKEGYGTDAASEEQQLADAVQLRGIKQRWYDLYAAEQGKRRLNAVLFVVCADTDHATQVTELLRTPRYFGRELAVLQVDSKHEDATTQRLLENLDSPESPVLAVVSVNKLKEGWDVKNIAVVVTLRAMASEVLTQQTMGRGLRLPFGSYTGILQIDQLDIIAHQSFRELLEAENVLVQFGLEEAASEEERPSFEYAVTDLASGGGVGSGGGQPVAPAASGSVPDPGAQATGVAPASVPVGGAEGGSPGVGVREIVPGGESEPGSEELSIVEIGRNPAFSDVSYLFPCTRVVMQQPRMLLSDIDSREIERAAKRVVSTGDVLVRKEIVAAAGVGLRTRDTESAEVDSIRIDDEKAESALVKLVMSGNLVTANKENALLARNYLVRTFMREAPVDHWTVKSLASANDELGKLVKEFAADILRKRTEETEVVPKRLPGTNELRVPLGEAVHEPLEDGRGFVRGRFYSGWFKSLYEAESFDSYSGEYALARLLNTSPHIVWWHRLHPQDKAFIYYNPKDRYFPDFVALDDEGVHWIIEGKDKRGRDDARVQEKRRAAEGVVHRLLGVEGFADQRWGYLIAYEDDIARSDSWDDLKVKSEPVSN